MADVFYLLESGRLQNSPTFISQYCEILWLCNPTIVNDRITSKYYDDIIIPKHCFVYEGSIDDMSYIYDSGNYINFVKTYICRGNSLDSRRYCSISRIDTLIYEIIYLLQSYFLNYNDDIYVMYSLLSNQIRHRTFRVTTDTIIKLILSIYDLNFELIIDNDLLLSKNLYIQNTFSLKKV